MAIQLNDNLKINVGNPIDSRYLNSCNYPYVSVAAVNAAIPQSQRYSGLTVNILNTEYWYQTGTNDGNLVIKNAGSTGGTNICSSDTQIIFNNNNIISGSTGLLYCYGIDALQINNGSCALGNGSVAINSGSYVCGSNSIAMTGGVAYCSIARLFFNSG